MTCTGSLYRVILDGTCVVEPSCPYNMYGDHTDLNDQRCLDCDPNCEVCEGTPTHCTACNGLYLDAATNTCVDPCPSVHPYGFWKTPAPAWTCDPCHGDCGTCYGFLNTECVTCFPGKHKELGTDHCIICPADLFVHILSIIIFLSIIIK